MEFVLYLSWKNIPLTNTGVLTVLQKKLPASMFWTVLREHNSLAPDNDGSRRNRLQNHMIDVSYCQHQHFSDLTIMTVIVTGRKCYIFHRYLCYIQAGKKSLKILDATIQNTADLCKML